jgi:hypothetical protein
MEWNCYPAPARVTINPVGPVAAIEGEAVSDQSRNDFASGEITEGCVVDAHGSDSDGYSRFDSDFYVTGGFLWDVFAVLNHALDDHVDERIDLLERFSLRGAPG